MCEYVENVRTNVRSQTERRQYQVMCGCSYVFIVSIDILTSDVRLCGCSYVFIVSIDILTSDSVCGCSYVFILGIDILTSDVRLCGCFYVRCSHVWL